MNEQIAVRTRFFDDFFTGRNRFRHPAGGHPGVRARHPRLPAGRGRRAPSVFEIDQPEVIEFKTRTLAELGAEPTAERRTVGDRPARRLADGAARRRLRPDAADRVDRRGPADLPAARGAGPAARRHHRAVRAGQPDRHRAHGHGELSRRLGREADGAVRAHRLRRSTWPSCSTRASATARATT